MIAPAAAQALAPFQREDCSGDVRSDDALGGALVLRPLLRHVRGLERLAVAANSRQQEPSRRRQEQIARTEGRVRYRL